MQIGNPQRTHTVEPVEDPVPRERPAEPVEEPLPAPAEPKTAPRR